MSRTMFKKVLMLIFAFMLLVTCVWAAEWVDFEGKTPQGKTLQLRGILNKPKGRGHFPAVVMLCGCGGLKNKDDAEQQNAWSERLMSWGYITLSVDSYGPRNYARCDDGLGVNFSMISYDAYSAKSYLSKLKFVDSKNIAVIGWSHGAGAVLRLVDGMLRDKESIPFKAAVAFYPWCEYINKFDTPLLILIGEKDDYCPVNKCETLQKAHSIKESQYEFTLKIYSNATHAFDFEGLNINENGHHVEYNPEATADAVIQTKEFLAKYLKAK